MFSSLEITLWHFEEQAYAILVNSFSGPFPASKTFNRLVHENGFDVEIKYLNLQFNSNSCRVYAAQNIIIMLEESFKFPTIPSNGLISRAKQLFQQ